MSIRQDILITQATCDDIERIANIEIENHFSDSNPLDRILNDLFLNEYKKRWRKKLATGMPTFLISIADKCVGFINYSFQYKTAEIHHIYILPEHRRKNLGRELCHYALKKMRESSINSVNLWLVEGRKQIIRFYKAIGFHANDITRIDKITKDFTLTERKYILNIC